VVSKIEDFPLILLAGGQSSRMGTPKGLIDFKGRSWLLEQLARFKNAGGTRAILTLGYHLEAYFEKIPWLTDTRKRPSCRLGLKISTVINPHPEKGQFSSLLAAFASPLLQAAPGVFVLPIDVPGPDREVYELLFEAFADPLSVVIPRYHSRGGHPVLLSAPFMATLSTISPEAAEARLDVQIRHLPTGRMVQVPVDDPQVCLNINSKVDFRDYFQNHEPPGSQHRH
jgi:molybdenum cofactor cytidylyltransferase